MKIGGQMRTCPVHQRNGKINYNSFLRPEDVEYEANEIRSEAIMYDMNILNAVQEYVHDRVSYARDRAKYNRPDYWKFSQETLVDGFGDCEDTSILMTSILLRY